MNIWDLINSIGLISYMILYYVNKRNINRMRAELNGIIDRIVEKDVI